MPVDHRKALIKNRLAILRDLANPDDVADHLFIENHLTEEMKEMVHVCKS